MSTDKQPATMGESVEQDRLAEIRDARRAARKARYEAREEQLHGKLSRGRAAMLYRSAIESFLMELKPYADYDAAARRFWSGFEDREIGSVVADPPSEDSSRWTDDPQVSEPGVRYESLDARELYHVTGLIDVLEAPEQLTAEFTYYENARYDGWVEYRATVALPLGFDILDTAFDWGRQFSKHVGFDLDPTDGDDDRELDGAKLLSDV